MSTYESPIPPFPWHSADVPVSYQATFHEKTLTMFRKEVQKRASLLMHLGWPKEHTLKRCRDNLLWDYELNGTCPILGEVESLVSEVYRRSHK